MAKHVAGAIIFSIFTLFFGAIIALSLRGIYLIQNATVDELEEFILFLIFGPVGAVILVGIAIGAAIFDLLFLILTIVKIVKAVKHPKKESEHSTGPEPKLG